METDRQKILLIAAATLAVALHIVALYAIGWIGISSRKQPQKILIPVTMQIKQFNKVTKPKIPVRISHIHPQRIHPVKTAPERNKTGHNRFLARSTTTNHGFSVPSGGNIKAGTVLAHQGTSATSTSVSNNIFLPPIPIFNPLPVIPSNLRTHGYSTYVRVEFFVNRDASFTSKLLSSTGYDELDRVVIDTLKKWKFSPATMDGQPVNGTLKLRIQFSVN
ncbi:MAG: TonB family protein [Deltaproteobacteria bacterium]|nr:TonB family protein [Deltaproteobacteria bacterium]